MREVEAVKFDDVVIADDLFVWRCPRLLGVLWRTFEGFMAEGENWELSYNPLQLSIFDFCCSFIGPGEQVAEMTIQGPFSGSSSLTWRGQEYVLSLSDPGTKLLTLEGDELVHVLDAWKDSDRERGVAHQIQLREDVSPILAALTYGAVLLTMSDADRNDF